MREILTPPLRAAAFCALLVGLLVLMVNPPSLSGLEGLLALVAGAAAIALVTAWVVIRLAGPEMPEPEFRRLEDRSEMLGALARTRPAQSEFDELVMEAIDDLPPDFREMLQKTPVMVSDRGQEHGAYGLYMGATIARGDTYPDRIVIFRDTLERDFGHDPDLLRAQVEQTVRHELAHHLGWDEGGVRGLGL